VPGSPARHANDERRQPSTPEQAVDRRQDLPESQIAGGAENHQRVGFGLVHGERCSVWRSDSFE
jgi:hypothetical protein